MAQYGKNKGFTLVEILIVVIILGILAAIVLPKFSSATATARASMMADDLLTFRTQLMVFKGQHADIPPGCATRGANPTSDLFVKHMTMVSDDTGATAAFGTAGYRYGPYLREIPMNPINGKRTVQVVDNGAALPTDADDSHGWIYQADTMTLKSDAVGADDSGKTFIAY